MVIAQFGHFWESAITAYLATDAAEERPTVLIASPNC